MNRIPSHPAFTLIVSLLLVPLLALSACHAPRESTAGPVAPGADVPMGPTGATPTVGPGALTEWVNLEAEAGWEARLLWDGDAGVWTVFPADVVPPCAGPEIVALDDRGRLILLGLYASKVSYWQPVMDGLWLGGVAHDDIDPRIAGPELYVGGKRGNLYQVKHLPQGGFNCKVIAYFPGNEIHTLVAADLDPDLPGRELYAGLIMGGFCRITPPATPDGAWTTDEVYKDPGRVRDAIVLTPEAGGLEEVIYVGRAGSVVHLKPVPGGGLEANTLYTCPQGLARIAQGRDRTGKGPFYVVGDDGQLMGFYPGPDGGLRRERIYAGAPGARGIAPGRFTDDPEDEALALFGYSGDVELLTRKKGGGIWERKVLFTDVDKGHWLFAGELDDRNDADEIVISGYGKRVVLLSRPPVE